MLCHLDQRCSVDLHSCLLRLPLVLLSVPLALCLLPASLGPWREEGGLGRGGLAEASSSQASVPLRTPAWAPCPQTRHSHGGGSGATLPRCQGVRCFGHQARGRGTKPPGCLHFVKPLTLDNLIFLSAPRLPLKKETVLGWEGEVKRHLQSTGRQCLANGRRL